MTWMRARRQARADDRQTRAGRLRIVADGRAAAPRSLPTLLVLDRKVQPGHDVDRARKEALSLLNRLAVPASVRSQLGKAVTEVCAPALAPNARLQLWIDGPDLLLHADDGPGSTLAASWMTGDHEGRALLRTWSGEVVVDFWIEGADVQCEAHRASTVRDMQGRRRHGAIG